MNKKRNRSSNRNTNEVIDFFDFMPVKVQKKQVEEVLNYKVDHFDHEFNDTTRLKLKPHDYPIIPFRNHPQVEYVHWEDRLERLEFELSDVSFTPSGKGKWDDHRVKLHGNMSDGSTVMISVKNYHPEVCVSIREFDNKLQQKKEYDDFVKKVQTELEWRGNQLIKVELFYTVTFITIYTMFF